MHAVEIIKPKNRVAWLQARNADITASVVAALFGEHEFTTVFELWALKTGRIPHLEGETAAMQRGRLLEPVAVQLMREQRPDWRIEHNSAENTYYREPSSRLGGTPDVMVSSRDRGRGVVQIKSVEASVFRRKWLDEDGNVEPPLWIALQATLEAHLTGSDWAAVAPLVVGHGVEMPLVEVPIVPGVIEAMRERSAEFWELVASGNEPQPDFSRDAAIIERIYGMGDQFDEVDLTADNRIPALIDERRECMAEREGAQRRINEIDAEIKAKMGSAHIAHIPGGQKITWKPQKRAGFFVEPVTSRVLRYPQNQKD
ncbi:YqaJ viral recombinase family protein [Agrobacterium deltaense]